MADTNPPDEVQNVQAPTDGNIHAPQTDALEEHVRDREQHQLEQSKRDGKADEPPDRRLALQHDRADLVGDRAKGQLSPYDRMRRVNRRMKLVVSFVH